MNNKTKNLFLSVLWGAIVCLLVKNEYYSIASFVAFVILSLQVSVLAVIILHKMESKK